MNKIQSHTRDKTGDFADNSLQSINCIGTERSQWKNNCMSNSTLRQRRWLCRKNWSTTSYFAGGVRLVRPRRVVWRMMSGVVCPWCRRQLRRRCRGWVAAERWHTDSTATRHRTLPADVAAAGLLAATEQLTKTGAEWLRSWLVTAAWEITILQNDKPLTFKHLSNRDCTCVTPHQDQARRLRLWVRLYRLPETTPTIAIYYYSARKLILILPSHGG